MPLTELGLSGNIAASQGCNTGNTKLIGYSFLYQKKKREVFQKLQRTNRSSRDYYSLNLECFYHHNKYRRSYMAFLLLYLLKYEFLCPFNKLNGKEWFVTAKIPPNNHKKQFLKSIFTVILMKFIQVRIINGSQI